MCKAPVAYESSSCRDAPGARAAPTITPPDVLEDRESAAAPFAGWAPWWVLLETDGRRTGEPKTTPLVRGPVDGDVVC